MTLSTQDELKIVEAYKRGDAVNDIYAAFSGLYSTQFYNILTKHNVPRRGRKSNFTKIWELAKASGRTPAGHPFVADAAKPAQVKKTTPKVTSTQSIGVNVIKQLLASGVVTQADIDSLSTNASAPNSARKATAKPLSKAQIRSREKRQSVIDLYQQGSFSVARIAKITSVGLSTAQRYIKEHKG